ncbi:NUDIX hydrolase [Reticulomyxa filosa]|uniref:NUDIX hydrolase n=1 Tax=Reticulomyxa filosa TaxID=46433 RepID=X6NV65_RETFI|nr:NUDIX hydrolase [Reticulomyxa filosa]|eukprot:ETO30205.1 NUDIX hydrolase [Reticulomyxa filosa]
MKEVNWDLLSNKYAICLCGVDNYCRCGPSVATDIVAFLPGDRYIILVERKAPPFGLACVGGFVEVGESIEEAAVREYAEETHLEITDLHQVHTFSNPYQDPRRTAVSTVFIASLNPQKYKHLNKDNFESLTSAGDDAKKLVLMSIEDALQILTYKFDNVFGFECHRRFIYDAVKFKLEYDNERS